MIKVRDLETGEVNGYSQYYYRKTETTIIRIYDNKVVRRIDGNNCEVHID